MVNCEDKIVEEFAHISEPWLKCRQCGACIIPFEYAKLQIRGRREFYIIDLDHIRARWGEYSCRGCFNKVGAKVHDFVEINGRKIWRPTLKIFRSEVVIEY